VRNEINALDLQKQGNLVRMEKLSSEKVQLEEERSGLEIRLQDFAANVETARLNVQVSRGTVEQRQVRLKELQQELGQATVELDGFLRQQAEKKSRLNVLEQLQTAYEGFGAGAVAILKGEQNILGSLTDRIRVPDEYITPVEAILGSHLQLVLTQRPESAQEILAKLTDQKKGRASIAALELLTADADPSIDGVSETFALPEGAKRMLDVVSAEAEVLPLVRRLLSRVVIVANLAEATAAWRQCGGALDFVTRSGELLNGQGIFDGGAGSQPGKTAASILGRKNQIGELQSALGQLQEQVTESSRRKGAVQSEQTALQASLQQAQSDLRTQEVAIATRQGEFNALQNSQRILHQKIDTVVYEIRSLAGQAEEGQQKRAGLASRIGELEDREQVLQNQIAEANTLIETLREKRDSANAGLTEVKVALAAEEQLGASHRQQQSSLLHRLQEIAHLLDVRRNETAAFVTRREQFETEIEDSRGQIGSLQEKDRKSVV
jgi:chromosome segregation protein